MYKKLILLLFMTLSLNSSWAQEGHEVPLQQFPIVTSLYNVFPFAEHSDGSGQQSQIREWKTMVQLGFPIANKKVYILPGFEYHTQFSTEKLGSFKNAAFQRAYILNIGAIAILPNRWKAIPFYTKRIASVSDNTNNEDFFAASLLFNRKHNENLLYGFGAYHRNGFEANKWLPMVQFIYRYGNWLTDILVPSWAAQYYDFNKNTRLGVKATFWGNVFNSTNNTTSTSFGNNITNSFNTTTVGLHFRQRIKGKIFIFAEGGFTQNKFIEIRSNEPVHHSQKLELENNPYFSIGVQLLKK